MSSQLLIERMKQKERIEALEDERIDAIIEECEVALHYLRRGQSTSHEKLYRYWKINLLTKVTYDDFKSAILAKFEDAFFNTYGLIGVSILDGTWAAYQISDKDIRMYHWKKKNGMFDPPRQLTLGELMRGVQN